MSSCHGFTLCYCRSLKEKQVGHSQSTVRGSLHLEVHQIPIWAECQVAKCWNPYWAVGGAKYQNYGRNFCDTTTNLKYIPKIIVLLPIVIMFDLYNGQKYHFLVLSNVRVLFLNVYASYIQNYHEVWRSLTQDFFLLTGWRNCESCSVMSDSLWPYGL